MAKPTFQFELGEHAKDVITGCEGVILSRCEHLTGCVQYTLQPTGTDKEGKIRDSYWLDEGRLQLLRKKPIELAAAPAGGPQHRAPIRPTPRHR